MNRLVTLLLLLGAPGWVQGVLDDVQTAREKRGAPRVEHREALDAVAQTHADRIAAMPHAERLIQRTSIDDDLEAAGVMLFRRARMHMDMGRGYRDRRVSFSRSWSGHGSSWTDAMDPEFEAIGLATATADDGWVVFVAVLIDDIKITHDLAAVERRAIDAVNAVRIEHGLAPLATDARLTAAARGHSETMVRLDFFAHQGPDRLTSADRATRVGARFVRLAENIHSSHGYDDPVPVAVQAWMGSPGHRDNILDPEVTLTGMGVALAADGRILFTQMFMAPAEP